MRVGGTERTGTLLDLSGASYREVNAKTGDLAGVRPVRVVAGSDPAGLALEVLVCEWVKAGSPSLDAFRKVHSWRVGKRIYPLIVALADRGGSVWLFGPNTDGAPSEALAEDHAARMLQAALDEPHGIAARQRLSHLQRALTATQIPGVANSGLFASHYITATTGVRGEALWGPAVEKARPLLSERGPTLIAALGFTSTRTGAHASLLAADSGRPRALAVLLDEGETFDAGSPRFAVSPVAYGLSLAQREEVPWLMILRKSQVRLYPVSPDVGVGRRGQAETYFETDLALLGTDDAGFLTLVFSAEALGPAGSVEHMLRESERFATALGERLRHRVYNEAIPVLAVAVANELSHRQPDHADDLDLAYRLTLRILFRLLFQAYAEDRGLLPYGRNERYDRNALKTWAIDLASDPGMEFDPDSQSMWDDLIQVWRVIDTGDRAWDVPAYNGGLFGTDPDVNPEGALLAQFRLSNDVIGHTLVHLLVDATADAAAGAVDFRSLSVREFGTIYEGLLESSLSRTDIDLTIDKTAAYVPAKNEDDVVVNAGGVYFHNASGERKATGSYFTPSFAVEHLVERALDPTLADHLRRIKGMLDDGDEAAAAEAFFDFRVADLAMGSGHFLVAAIDHIEAGMASFLAEHHLPGIVDELRRLEGSARDSLGDAQADYDIEPSALLRRQIARRCIYGLDLNPIAVELARVALWIHTFVPGLPMSSLDHTLVCANSLTGIGTIEEALTSLEPKRKKGMPSLFTVEIEQTLEEARQVLMAAANTNEATKAEVRLATQASIEASRKARPTKLLFDAAVALRTGILHEGLGLETAEMQERASRPRIQAEIGALLPAHMPYLFPEVFLRENGGFDVLIGNPPWEKLHVEDHAWWALRFPGLRGMTAKDREERLQQLKEDNPQLLEMFVAEVARNARMRAVIASGPFPGIGSAHIDLFQAFAWRNWQVIREGGSIGIVLPRGAFAGSGTAKWRESVLKEGAFRDICFLTNAGEWVFAGVHQSYTIALSVIGKGASNEVACCGPFSSWEEYVEGREALVQTSAADFSTWSGTFAFPLLGRHDVAEAFIAMRKLPNLEHGALRYLRPVQGDVNTTQQKPMYDFDVKGHLEGVPVLTGASIHQYDAAFGLPYAYIGRADLENHLMRKLQRASKLKRSAFSGHTFRGWEDLPCSRSRVAYRRTVRATDSHTAIAALVPPDVALTEQAPFFFRTDLATANEEAFLLGVMNSLPFDWYTRRWVELNLSFELLAAMPAPTLDLSSPRCRRVIELAARLAAVDDRFEEWAALVGVPTRSLSADLERSAAIAELDALAALLYGLDWPDVEHIFETFHRGWNYSDRLAAVKIHYYQWSAKV